MSSSIKKIVEKVLFRPILGYFKVIGSQISSFSISQTFNGHIFMKIHDHEAKFFLNIILVICT